MSIPILFQNQIMIVTVRGTIDKSNFKGWRHVLENFYYECTANDGKYNRRPETGFIAFYRSHVPKAITHWGNVSNITEKDGIRRYHLGSLMKLKSFIKKGEIPPVFSGGGISIPLEEFFILKNLDELYENHRNV